MTTRFWSVALTLPLLMTLLASAQAQTLAQSPERALANTGFQDETAGWELGDSVGLSSMSVVSLAPTDAGGAKRGLRFEVVTAPNIQPWDIALRQNVGVGVSQNEPLHLSFWAKTMATANVSAGVEDSDDYHKIVWGDFALSSEWKRYEVTGQADRDFAPNKLRFIFNMGKQKARLWLADVRLDDPAHPLPDQLSQPVGPIGTLDKPLSLAANTNFEGDWQKAWSGNGLQFSALPQEFTTAAHLVIPAPVPNPWDARFAVSNPTPVNGGDVIAVQLIARSATKNKITLNFQQSSDPYSKFLSATIVLTPDWKSYRFVSTVDGNRHFEAGGTNFEIHAGYGVGEVDISGLKVEDFGGATRDEVVGRIGGETVDLWAGRPHDDAWRAAALERIERTRKADLRVRVVDAEGQPLPNAKIEAKMTRHAFRFGTAVASGAFWTSDSPATQQFKSIVADNFNTITLENGMKWTQDSPDQAAINADILAWAKAHDIQVRGHNLVWGSFKLMPSEIGGKKLADMNTDELKAAVEAHVRDYVRRYKGQVYIWDVVNEATAERELWDKVGWDEFARVFQIAREEDPNILLAYNDYKLFHLENDTDWLKEKAVIQKLVDAHVPLDILTEQAHMGLPLLPMPTVLSNLEELGRYGKPIEITEFDVGLRDDTAQADYVRDFMTACFSEPQVVSFVQWGFWEGAHWRAKEGGHLVRRDFSFRPAMDAYRDLVFKQWWTNANGSSDAGGAFTTRGFKGDYQVSASQNGKSVTQNVRLDDNTGLITLILK